jgi:hypothetical protein
VGIAPNHAPETAPHAPPNQRGSRG